MLWSYKYVENYQNYAKTVRDDSGSKQTGLIAGWGKIKGYSLPTECFCLKISFTSSVQLLSHVWLFVTPWITACQASLSITSAWSPPKPMSIESVMPSNHLILCRPLLLLPSIFPSIRGFSSESALHIRWSFSFSISPSNEFSGLIFFRIDRFDLLEVWGTLKSLLQHHNSKASILWCSALWFYSPICPWLLEKP